MIVRNITVRTICVLVILINLNSGMTCSNLPQIIIFSLLKAQCDSLNQVSVVSFNLAGSDPLIVRADQSQLFGFSLELRAKPGPPSLYVGDPLHQQQGDVPGAVYQCR